MVTLQLVNKRFHRTRCGDLNQTVALPSVQTPHLISVNQQMRFYLKTAPCLRDQTPITQRGSLNVHLSVFVCVRHVWQKTPQLRLLAVAALVETNCSTTKRKMLTCPTYTHRPAAWWKMLSAFISPTGDDPNERSFWGVRYMLQLSFGCKKRSFPSFLHSVSLKWNHTHPFKGWGVNP